MQVLIVQREPAWKTGANAAAEAGAALDVLAHHQHGVVQHALRALRHRVHPDHKNDVDDALLMKSKERNVSSQQ